MPTVNYITIVYQTNLSIFNDFLEIMQVKNRIGIDLPPNSTYMQSFNFRTIPLPEISMMKTKALLIITEPRSQSVSQPPSHLAQSDTAVPQMI